MIEINSGCSFFSRPKALISERTEEGNALGWTHQSSNGPLNEFILRCLRIKIGRVEVCYCQLVLQEAFRGGAERIRLDQRGKAHAS